MEDDCSTGFNKTGSKTDHAHNGTSNVDQVYENLRDSEDLPSQVKADLEEIEKIKK